MLGLVIINHISPSYLQYFQGKPQGKTGSLKFRTEERMEQTCLAGNTQSYETTTCRYSHKVVLFRR